MDVNEQCTAQAECAAHSFVPTSSLSSPSCVGFIFSGSSLARHTSWRGAAMRALGAGRAATAGRRLLLAAAGLAVARQARVVDEAASILFEF